MFNEYILKTTLLVATLVPPTLFIGHLLLNSRNKEKVQVQSQPKSEEATKVSKLSTRHQALLLWDLQAESTQILQQVIQGQCSSDSPLRNNEVMKIILYRELMCLCIWASLQGIKNIDVARELVRIYLEMPGIDPTLDKIFLLPEEEVRRRFTSYDESWSKEDSMQAATLLSLATYMAEGASEIGVVKKPLEFIPGFAFFGLIKELYGHMSGVGALVS